jgi:hypothetical protein
MMHMVIKSLHMLVALTLTATSAVAQGDNTKYPLAPATVLFRTTCSFEAGRYGLRDAERAAFMADCHAQRLAARAQIAQNCRQAARDHHYWGLARHKFIRKCTAETKSFVVQPRVKTPPVPVFSPNP